MELTLCRMAHGYLPYDIDQRLLLPPDMRAWLPEGHLALFILDVVGELDLSQIYAVYDAKDERGRAGYHPAMMVALLIYGYCTGRPSSRRIERATHEDVAFRVIAGDRHPDHDSIAAFRKQHLEALAGLFMPVLQRGQRAEGGGGEEPPRRGSEPTGRGGAHRRRGRGAARQGTPWRRATQRAQAPRRSASEDPRGESRARARSQGEGRSQGGRGAAKAGRARARAGRNRTQAVGTSA